ncbi:MAG: GNAT family N-acetyltransferase [Promethearchaeota archaeon]
MEPRTHELDDGLKLLIREATAEDSRSVLDYVQQVCGESDFLTFGPGEFGLNEQQEKEFIENNRGTENRLVILGLISSRIVSVLNFSGGQRPRIRHCGELGMTVKRQYWGRGIGTLMLDVAIAWARDTHIIKKINLRVRTDNTRAISLYEKKGFLKEGTIRKEIFIDGKYYDHHWMSLELDG